MSSLIRLSRAVTTNPILAHYVRAHGRPTFPWPINPHETIARHVQSVQQTGLLTLTPTRPMSHDVTCGEPSHVARVQCPAPNFQGMAVVDGQFKQISLKDFAGKYLVLFFYPLDFTFVCPTEVIAFNDRQSEFKELNTELVAVSVDSHFSHMAWIKTPRKNGGLGPETTMPILSDLKKSIAADYGCLTQNKDIALRALYIIDTKGIVRQVTINDLPVGRSVDEVLRLVKAFQFTDEHGEVCPANWQPKSKTINPKKASEYFSSEYSK